jgi:hypothetical protein
MVVEEVVEIPVALLGKVGQIALWLQAVGVILVIWMIFLVVNFILNRKRIKEIYTIKKDMAKMDKKLDLLLKRK